MPYAQHMTYGYASPEAIVALEDDRDAYAEYVRQITGDGDSIVECLTSIMDDDDAKPYEKLDAQLLLDSIGYGRLAVDQADAAETQTDKPPVAPPQPHPPAPWAPANPRRPRRPAFTLSEETLFHLPALVREKTDNGKKMADFLNAVINGELPDFKPRHRIRAAKQLAARAYSRDRDPNYGLGEIDPDSTMRLIETLTAGFKERMAREQQEAALQPTPSLLDILQPPCDSDECQHPVHDDGQPSDSTTTWNTSVLDYPTCPSNHTYECECFEEERERREAHQELDQAMREHFGLSQLKPP